MQKVKGQTDKFTPLALFMQVGWGFPFPKRSFVRVGSFPFKVKARLIVLGYNSFSSPKGNSKIYVRAVFQLILSINLLVLSTESSPNSNMTAQHRMHL